MSGYPRQNKKRHPLEIGKKLAFSPKYMYLSFKKIKKHEPSTQWSREPIYFGQNLMIFKKCLDLAEMKILL